MNMIFIFTILIIRTWHWIVLIAAFGGMSETVHWSQFLLTLSFWTLDCEFNLAWCIILKKKKNSPATVLRHRLFTAFLFSASVAHSCTVRVPLVACCRLSTGGWMLKCVCGEKTISLMLHATFLPKPSSWQELCVCYIVMPSIMQLYTLYWPST